MLRQQLVPLFVKTLGLLKIFLTDFLRCIIMRVEKPVLTAEAELLSASAITRCIRVDFICQHFPNFLVTKLELLSVYAENIHTESKSSNPAIACF